MTVKERHYYLIVKPELQNTIQMPGTETSDMSLKLIHYRKEKEMIIVISSNRSKAFGHRKCNVKYMGVRLTSPS